MYARTVIITPVGRFESSTGTKTVNDEEFNAAVEAMKENINDLGNLSINVKNGTVILGRDIIKQSVIFIERIK